MILPGQSTEVSFGRRCLSFLPLSRREICIDGFAEDVFLSSKREPSGFAGALSAAYQKACSPSGRVEACFLAHLSQLQQSHVFSQQQNKPSLIFLNNNLLFAQFFLFAQFYRFKLSTPLLCSPLRDGPHDLAVSF